MLRLFRISPFVLTFLIATASSLTTIDAAEHPIVPDGAAAVAVTIPSIDLAACVDASSRQSFKAQPQAVRGGVDSSSLSILPLKTLRTSARIAASGNIKFRHASNAPPVHLC